MHWSGSLVETGDHHLASKSHPQATCGWRGTWPQQASSVGSDSMGSSKAAAAPRYQLDAYHSAGLDQDQSYYAAAAGAVHTPFPPSPARSSVGAGSVAAKQPSNGFDAMLLNHLLLQTTADSHSNLQGKAATSGKHHQQQQLLQQLRLPHNSHAPVFDSSALTPPTPSNWRLGTDVQCEPTAAPELQELLAKFPASQQQVLLDSMMASSKPQELLLTLQPAAATNAVGSPLQTHHNHQQQVFDYGSAYWLHQAMAAAGSSPSQHSGMADLLLHPSTPTATTSTNDLLQQLQLQASLAAEQAAMSSGMPAAAPPSMSAAQQQLLLQQLQSVAAAANNPGALAQLLQQQQLYSHGQGHPNAAAAAGNLWNLAAAGLGSPAAAAAALAAQQQQAAMSALLAQAALAQQRQQQHSSMLAAGQYYQQLAAQLLASQTAAASSPGSSYSSRAASSFGSLPSSATSRSGSSAFGSARDGMASSFQRAPSGPTKGRRNSRALSSGSSRALSSGSSRANSTGMSGSVDVFGYLGSSSGGSSRASSYAGSDMDAAADSTAAALAAGLTLQDLCPRSFEDTWGATAGTAAGSSSSSNVSSAGSDAASTTWLSSSSGTASAASSRGSSKIESAAAAAEWQSGDEAEDCKTARSLRPTSHHQQQQQQQSMASPAVKRPLMKDQSAAAPAGGASGKQQQLSKVGGCPVWYPGAREASGDDSWYLALPPTCRLFVGNIGSWVDEDALLGYFGKYGKVVDVQVMWNTKMLARGRRVNREFAFISYASPLEAARAVHWLDGCRLPDLEKDRNGITVEYENGEGEADGNSSGSGAVAVLAGAR